MDILTESKPKQIEKSFDSLQPMEMEEVVPLPKKKPIGSVESLSSNEMTRKVTIKELSLQKERDESVEASNNSLCIKIPPKQASDMKSNTPPRSPLTKAPKSPLTSNSDLTKPRAPQSPLVTAEVLSRSPFSHLTNTEGPRSPFSKTENVIPLPIAQVKEIVTEKESESASRSSSFKSTKRVSFHNTNGDAPPIVEAVADKVVGDDIKVDAVPEQVSKEPRSRSTSGSSARRPSIPKRPTATETTEPQMVTSPITSPIIKDPKSEQNMQAVLEMIKQSSQTSINPLPQQKAGPRKHSNTVTSPSSSDQWPRTNPLLRETSIRSTRIDSSASQRTETSGIRSRLPSSSSTDPRFRAGSIADPRFRSGSILEKDEKRIMTKNSTLTMLDVKTDVKRTVT
jgi:hypothetical protein